MRCSHSIRSIKKSLHENERSTELWQEYREVLQVGNREYRKTEEQNRLLNLGLVVREDNYLKVTNLIFLSIFNQDFVSRQINNKANKIPVKKKENVKNKSNIESNIEAEEEIFIKSLNFNTKQKKASLFQRNDKKLAISGIMLSIPSLLLAISLFSPTNKINPLTFLQNNEADLLQKSCEDIDISDSKTRLNSILRLEQQKTEFADSNSNSSVFPENCESTLNSLRMLAIPELGQDNNVIETVRFLCNVPETSASFVEAKVWLNRWSYSPTWSKDVKYYLEEAHSCPAGIGIDRGSV